MVEPAEVAKVLNNMGKDGCSIHYVIPCHEYDGTRWTNDRTRKTKAD